MADQKKVESEKMTLKLSSGSKRVYREAHFSEDEIDVNSSLLNHDQSTSSKRFKAYSYRDQNTESQDTDSLRNTLGSPGFTDSLDSGSWSNMLTSSPPSASRNPSLASLELSSIIQRYDNATLNSLSMSQMSSFSDNAMCSPTPQAVDMDAPTLSSLNSISMAQILNYSPKARCSPGPQAVGMTSPMASSLNSLNTAQILNYSSTATCSPAPQTVGMASPTASSLNSPSMAQMSNYSHNVLFSPIPQTKGMTSPSASKSIPSLELNSLVQKSDNATEEAISWSQVSMMSFSQDSVTNQVSETVEMASLSSQTSMTGTQESIYGQAEVNHVSDSSPVPYDTKSKLAAHSSPLADTQPMKNESPSPAIVSEVKVGRHEYQLDKNLPQGKISVSQKIVTRKIDVLTKTDGSPSKTEDHGNVENERDDSDSDTSINIQNESNPELKENFKTCKKNPGHEKFYSPKELKVTDLPQDIQHEDSVTFFQCLSNLVVQISVSSTSDRRSEDDVYSSYKGTKKERNGSGFIVSTDKHIMRIKCTKKDCPHRVFQVEGNETLNTSASPGFDRTLSNMSTCSSASVSSNDSVASSGQGRKHFVYGGVYVRTNKHVIYDKSEADWACVNFFFHSSDKKDVVKGHVASIHGVNNDQDHIVLHVMSHDKRLLDIVGLHLKNAKSSYDQMIRSTHNTQQNYGRNKLSWVAVISHPHGTANSVSFGRLKKEEAEVKRVIKYYDAATCPGSSGGLVVTPTLLHLQWPGAVHSSFCQKTKFNVSLDSRFQELDTSVIGQIYKNILNRKDSVPENQFRL